MTVNLTLCPASVAAALRHAAHAAEDQARHDRARAAITLAARVTGTITLAAALATLFLQVLG